MRAAIAALACAVASATHSHVGYGPLNPLLGTHGFPDCVAGPEGVSDDIEANQLTMICKQRQGAPSTIKIGCVGDSITAGAHSSGGNHPYPQQLQLLLDPTQYTVTNLGACGSTMQKDADSPYWKRPQFAALTAAKWDVIVIMLGTNDAKDAIDGGPSNWVCGDDINNVTVANCRFAQDYLSFIDLVRTLGPDANTPPKIFVAAPPPLMAHGSIGANQTVINSVYPTLVPLIAQAANVSTVPISAYAGMGGVPTWERDFPKQCTLDSPWAACPWYCDAQSCDQCHPNDNGYHHLAEVIRAGMDL